MSESTAEAVVAEVTETVVEPVEVDWKVEAEKAKADADKWKAMSRETEKKAAANRAAADELAQIKDAQKSAEQRQADELAALRQEAEAARTESLRWRVAATHGISAEDAELFLTGRDEETMTAQATRLAEKLAAPAPKAELKPDPSQGPRGGSSGSTADQFASALSPLLNF
jgi:hypothetical protein